MDQTNSNSHPEKIITIEDKKSKNNSAPSLNRMSTKQRLNRFLAGKDKAPLMTLQFINMFAEAPITPKSKKMKTILNNISGVINPGEFVALMGPSGAGKSTLLNMLGARFHGSFSGEILINGQPRSKKFKRNIGYVLQLDTLLPNLTVRETLEITARLRLPKALSYQTKMDRVDDIIHVMGLTECENTAVNKLSGGESKRVSIANELLINPSVILLDEPISGLDSTTALAILVTLKQLCENGRSIICAIHQPSSHMFYKFDKLALLASSNLVYFGTISDCLPYFENIDFKCPIHYNPADFVLELTTDNFTTENSQDSLEIKEKIKNKLIESWKIYCENNDNKNNNDNDNNDINNESSNEFMSLKNGHKKKTTKKNNTKTKMFQLHQVKSNSFSTTDIIKYKTKWHTNWCEQFMILASRAFKHRKGHIISWVRFLDIALICLLSGMLWFQIEKTESKLNDFLAANFTIQVYVMFMTMYLGVVHFPVERNVLNKERQSGAYRLSAYYFSKVTSELPVDIFFPMLCITIFYWMAGFCNNFLVYLEYLGITCLGIAASNSLGIFIGCAFYNFERALSILTVSGMFMMIISGFLIKNATLPNWVNWIKYFAFTRYEYLTTTNLLLKNNKFKCDNPSLAASCQNATNSGYISMDDISAAYGFQEPKWLGILILSISTIGWHFLAYVAIRCNTKTR